MLPQEGVNAVRVVVALLVAGDYAELETLTEGRRLSASDMADAIEGHGLDLISPPEEAFGDVGVHGIEQTDEQSDEDGRTFRVAFPLWTAQEGRSALRLRLRLTLSEFMDDVWTVELDGISAP